MSCNHGKEAENHQGKVIKTIGDEILCTFPDAEYAFYASCAMQRAVEQGEYEGDQKLNVRIGFHYGDVLCESNDVYGDVVNVASRVMSITRANQIMTTLAVSNALKPAQRDRLRQILRAEFKGKQERYDIFLVTWALDDNMTTRVGIPSFRKTSSMKCKLHLIYNGQKVVVDNERRIAVLGREKVCDVVMLGDYVSREHARIELRYDKFILIDQSTNSTFIRSKDGRIVFHINHEEMILHGRQPHCQSG